MTTQSIIPASLRVELLSDATFSRGEGTAGLVDIEVEHDSLGLPLIGGRTIRGLLRDSWLSMQPHFPDLNDAAARVLGRSKSLDDECRLRVGDAYLPEPIREAVRISLQRSVSPLGPEAILDAFTDIRYQTAEDRSCGAPEITTLRSTRVVLRGFRFKVALTWLDGYQPNSDDLQVLALCALVTRHGGLTRNRGRGHLRCTLDGDLALTRRLAEGDSKRRAS
ncbi:RAMP superfamily protein [Lujinxingia litoralis]|uniref:RAMP superfamily protein n=1 Tax=Lujinxingia litoralis TaxID=2211119 RepID=A0A328C4I5_9DELT|nr:RAMP superfamily protein [Lujinxingia litoralis]